MKERKLLQTASKIFFAIAIVLSFSLENAEAQPTMTISKEKVDRQDTVRVTVTTSNFTGIAGMQYSHSFDSLVLQYVDIENKSSQLSGLAHLGPESTRADNGQIIVTWNDPGGGTVDLTDGTQLYEIVFVAIGNECDSTDIAITDDPTKAEAYDDDLNDLGLNSVTGQVKINGTDCVSLPDVTIRLNENSGNTGTEICLQARVDGFQEIESFQWSMSWDLSVATFSRVTNFNLTDLEAGDFAFDMTAGALRCIWTEEMGNSVSVPNATRIFDVCFNLIGMPGEMTDVDFVDTPLPVQFNRDTGPVGHSTGSGKLTIRQMGAPDSTCIYMCDAVGDCKENICVDIKVKNFVDISSMQFSIDFPAGQGLDPGTPLSRNHGLIGFGTADIANPSFGKVVVVWSDPGGGCQSLADDAVLFQLCFRSETGPAMYNINFSNTPQPLDLADCDVDPVPAKATVGAKITVNECDEPDEVTIRIKDTLRQACHDRCNGFIDLDVVGGSGQYTFRWFYNGSQIPDTSEDLFNRCGGTYRVIACDAADPNNCDTLDFTLSRPLPLMAQETITPATSGCNGEVSLNITGGTPGYSVTWSNNANSTTVTDLCKGTISAQIVDSRNCVLRTDTFVITGAPIVIDNVDITQPRCSDSCDGAIDITVSGGCGPLTYAWTGEGVDSDAEDQTGLCVGDYKVVVTDTSGGMTMQTITIQGPPPLEIVLDSIQNGNPGFIFVSHEGGTGGYVIKWTAIPSGNLVGQSEDLGPVPPGLYVNMITDANGCVTMDTFNLSDRDLEVTVNKSTTPGGTNVTCFGDCDGTADVIVSMGSGNYVYEWSHDVTETSPNLFDLCAGEYKVTVVDQADGKTIVVTFEITEPDDLIAMIMEMDCASANGAADGVYRVVADGGVGGYNYLWCNNSTAAVPQNLVGGSNCNVLVTDANGCQVFEEFEVCFGGEPIDEPCFIGRDVITPSNGDGINDNFTFTCNNDPRYRDNTLTIYNRRGQLVNMYRNYTNQWRGTDESGNLVEEDAYMWVLEILLPSGTREVYRGTVTVINNN